MKKLMGVILCLIFLLIIFLNKNREGLSQLDVEEWNKLVEEVKTFPKWEDLKVNFIITLMSMNVEKLKILMKKGTLESTNLGGAKRVLFEDLKESKRVYTDEDYRFINELACSHKNLINKPLKDLLDYLTTQVDVMNRIKDEYKVDKDTTLKELDDKIKDS
jgi:hypothetical protein